MQTQLAPEFQGTPEGREAEAILRKCVHCGFCTATCPTYQLLGDELDGPRGRIYLIKQVLEGETPTRKTQLHLDRCLTCRNCETTCPSGVQYGRLVDIGRHIVEKKVRRPLPERARRWALKEGVPSPLFAPALKAGQAVRGLLPAALRAKVPRPQEAGAWPVRTHARKVLMLAGCVQPAMLPNVNRATARVLDAAGIQTVIAAGEGCCGAVKFHLNDQEGGRAQMRANIDAWWPHVEEGGVEAIVVNASGCGVTVKDYGHLLQDDPAYAGRAARVSALARDLSELLPDMLPALAERLAGRVDPPKALLAYHPPCTLQHGQKLRGGVEAHLARLGFRLRVARTESHLCCGSAGTYSLLQPEIAGQLRDRKLGALGEACAEEAPAAILSANIGCITHLQGGTATPVRHWIEVLDEALRPGAG
ncbi:glycolate oxidase subunit GlcF [Paracidovorax anthurii]|uniref:Glycolate oxidase iron-sulfur subunit n=1 Tax=Paracidovorax anthurii TaxID=78229 RepID=A0A328ZKT5_9BURK|nr:glycolate oxidase subunit GlcF [Paracidovorax anthurii]RAR86521.1 glycolate oxidase iron-sulfur subunit [Paracidovorax anthurii]